MNRSHTVSQHVSCNDCSLSPVCLPLAVAPTQLDELDRIIHRGRPLKRGEHLFRAADEFQAVYAVRSGALKTYVLSDEGDEQVTGFYLPGEVLGMDGISTAHHMSNAKALETATVCEIPFSKLEMLSQRIPSLQHHFFSLMSNEIRSDRELHMLLSKKNADDRVASLLISMSARHQRRGLSERAFRLPMSRYDIANYLGLAVETVSRIFTRFQQNGWLRVEGREVEILNRRSLCGEQSLEVSL
ncbi:MAG TPA: fumarate/nitrate reduction transcriptional regulator Fnr [Alcanivorax sp.]|uniref:fumarate/nitrate reduction transcriptional regulator Fnr n=1 Tax=Alcanivorax TaxID=59753 RepID=UPI00054DEE42|nr:MULTISPECIES: fumarate/nitrate reduction transcriptional regulator Fnr [Alcanivorax]MAC16235.1 fumarate/nitrate reduction transcriptional regulator Fnr [Alcanivorax sp.]MDF1638573.1 fumarate/nitrate reduction transcriptional regulator Fnr [Alcanivorax jadensis]HBC17794.1 fumarate/nitrate reduction transcriptional regulator Fnr [Alcanivorax sp.]